MAVIQRSQAAPPLSDLGILELRERARENRIDVANMFMAAGNGHFGSCYSCTEIITALYFRLMRIDPANPDWADRDRFIMGKGHAAPTLYSALIRRGFFSEDWIPEYETRVGARLMTHPSRRYQPGVDASQGSLGHGLSIAVGMGLAARMDDRDFNVFALLGDGELNEGSIWEAAMAASKFRLSNLTAIVDRNQLSVDGPLEEVMPLEPLADKWIAFGWDTTVVDGHSFEALLEALEPRRSGDGRPRAVIANTVKGKGVSFMEHVRSWHADTVSQEQYDRLMRELAATP